ncbi:MAG: tetratricopeptide repeat protein [Spirochaetaceae bacterium]|nr:tetratricopeptide repeat protein [Spirochaetaceae bacterium]
MKRIILIAISAFCLFGVFAQGSMEDVENLLSSGQYGRAISQLTKMVESEDCDPSAYGYLGYAYFQTKDFQLSKEFFLKMSEVRFADKALWKFNAGNAAFAQKDFTAADELYCQCLEQNSQYSAAYLNRGNARVQLNRYEEALKDYAKYLELEPENPQSDELLKLKNAIETLLAAKASDDSPSTEDAVDSVTENPSDTSNDDSELAVEGEIPSSMEAAIEPTKSAESSANTDSVENESRMIEPVSGEN